MDILTTVLTSVFSVIIIFLITKLIGARQISQLSIFDYINGITMGSIAADLAVAKRDDFWYVLISLIVFSAFTLFFALLTDKSIRARRFISGNPILLYKKGQIFDRNFKLAKLDMNEFLMQCRSQGYFDLAQIDTAYFEANGLVSILPVTSKKPATPSEIKADVQQEPLFASVVIDGKIMHKNLENIGFSDTWLYGAIGNTKISDIFLATCNESGVLQIYTKCGADNKDIF